MAEPERTAPRPTIADVAREAGVSGATVSRVINGAKWVSEETKAAVEAAISKTGFSANQRARSLATGRSNSIVFLLTEPQSRLFEDPTFSILLDEIGKELDRHDLALVLMLANSAREKERALRYLQEGHADGALLVSTHQDDELLRKLAKARIPTVACGLPIGHEREISSVSVDEAGGARMMTHYLRSQGCEEICFVAGPPDSPGGQLRLAGYREAMGSSFDPTLVLRGDYSRESGRDCATACLASGARPDCFFAASDLMAAGVIEAVEAAGLRVPEDIGVAGFDDGPIASSLAPPLTTVHQPFGDISVEMVEQIRGLISGGRKKTSVFEPNLVVRESTRTA